MVELIEIKFKDIEIRLPESREAVTQARKLLDLFEETLGGGTTEKPNPQKFKLEESTVAPLDNTDGYNIQECEKFDHSNLPPHKAGKSTYWLSDDAKRVCIEREGYAQGLYVYAAIEDLKYLQDHPDKIFRTLKKFTKHKKYHITGFLKDVEVSTLTTVTTGEQEAAEPKEEEHNEPEEKEPDNLKPKIVFFQEDNGFDYMTVQPKQLGHTQVYSKNGKMVIKANREIVLTTKDTIDRLLQYNENDLNYCIRGVNPHKQNILRIYLKEIKKDHPQTQTKQQEK